MATSLKVFSTTKKEKRVSLPISLWHGTKKGSLTVEASLALPFFIFFFINLISAIQMIGIQSNLTGAFHQVGKEMAIQGYLYDKAPISSGNVSWISSLALSNTYVKDKVIKVAGEENMDSSLIAKGSKGISFILSEIMVEDTKKSEDIIDIVGVYQVTPQFSVIPLFPINMMNRCRVRAWTGYDNTLAYGLGGEDHDDDGNRNVFVTETGQVYHLYKNCTHISLSIQRSDVSKIESLRNEGGGKYYPCESCGEEGEGSTVYITKTGDRYHSTTSCHGLKRTIKQIPLEEVGSRGLCSRCQGG